MKAITVNQLLKACQEQKRLGNGDKSILLSNDDEGNGYHEMFFTFTKASDIFEGSDYDPYYPSDLDLNNTIVLG